jgi:hypothetical protein
MIPRHFTYSKGSKRAYLRIVIKTFNIDIIIKKVKIIGKNQGSGNPIISVLFRKL